MARYFTPLPARGRMTADFFNQRFQELDNAIHEARLQAARGYLLSNYGGVGNGSYDNANAIAEAKGAMETAGGGVLVFGDGQWYTSELLELDFDLFTIEGNGFMSQLIGDDANGVLKISASYCSVKNLWIYNTGSGLSILSDNGKVFHPPSTGFPLRGRGPESLAFEHIKVTADAGAAGGILLRNTWFTLLHDIDMPGGDGTALDIESGGFNGFYKIDIVNKYADTGYNAWAEGLALHIQDRVDGTNSLQVCDDMTFQDVNIDGIDGFCLNVYSEGEPTIEQGVLTGGLGVSGTPPARMAFHRCLFGANDPTLPCVNLESFKQFAFYTCHAEHDQTPDSVNPPTEYVWEITAKATNNIWNNCSGEVKIHSPSAYQSVRGNVFQGHVHDIYIGTFIWGTTLQDHHSGYTDLGVDTWLSVTDETGTVGTFDRVNKVNALGFSDMANGEGLAGTLFYGNGTPSDAKGIDGDTYIRKNSDVQNAHALYKKSASKWRPVVIGEYHYMRRFVEKLNFSNGVAAGIFTIATNDLASAEGGAYSCFVKGIATHVATAGAGNNAAKAFERVYTRENISTSAGNTSAVTDVFTGAEVATVRGIGTVVMTVTEDTEFQVTVKFTLELTTSNAGVAAISTGGISALVEIMWTGYQQEPIFTAL